MFKKKSKKKSSKKKVIKKIIKPIVVDRGLNCPDCKGSGLKNVNMLCPRCGGTGK